jgi:hypothetical protein
MKKRRQRMNKKKYVEKIREVYDLLDNAHGVARNLQQQLKSILKDLDALPNDSRKIKNSDDSESEVENDN